MGYSATVLPPVSVPCNHISQNRLVTKFQSPLYGVNRVTEIPPEEALEIIKESKCKLKLCPALTS